MKKCEVEGVRFEGRAPGTLSVSSPISFVRIPKLEIRGMFSFIGLLSRKHRRGFQH